jgi:predicted MFS family arabinose efflux permease
VAAPLLLGALAATVAGWRIAMAVPALGFLLLFAAYRREPLPRPGLPPARRSARLPLTAWIFAVLVASAMGIEFCLIYFGAELLVTTGLSTTAAATALSSFYLGILVGRVGGAQLSRRTGRTATLIGVSLAVTTAGFLLFWLSGVPAAAVAGLLICGVGVANLYPLSISLTLAAARGHTDTANARSQLIGGVVVLCAPFLLGALADRVGLLAAFAVEPGLIAIAVLLLVTGLRRTRTHRTARPAASHQQRSTA